MSQMKKEEDKCDDNTTTCQSHKSEEKYICDTERRRLLGIVASGGSLALAGCTGIFPTPEAHTPDVDDEVYSLDFLRQEETVDVRGTQTILRAGEEAGFDLPYDCRASFCGVCLAKAEGEDANTAVNMAVNEFDLLTDEAVTDGYFLPCTSQPRSDFEVRSHVGWDELDPYQDAEEDEEVDEADTDDQAGVHAINYVNQNSTIYVPENRNLLSTGEDAGFDLPYRCREGWCGECLAKIDGDAHELVEMTVNDYEPLDGEAIEDGYTLTCTGYPRGKFTLESNKYGELDS